MRTRMARTPALVSDLIVLVATIALFSWLVVPCHYSSIWADIEFTGWVAPVANRLGQDVKLYADGGHSPMAPLPYVVLHVVSGGRATWWTESVAIVVAQGLMVVALYLVMSRRLPRPIPFLAAFLSIPVYLGLLKTIFYDGLAQVLVALVAGAAVMTLRPVPADESSVPTRVRDWRGTAWMAVVAALTALAILAKQSTGIGAAGGVLLMLGLLGSRPLPSRLLKAASFALLTLAMLALFSLAISRWVDVPGMARDVFLSGSEPKGGARRMLDNLLTYVGETYARVVVGMIYGVVLLAFVRPSRFADPLALASPETLARWEKAAPATTLAAIAPPVLYVGHCHLLHFRHNGISRYLGDQATTVLWAGLLLLFATAVVRLRLPNRSDRGGTSDWFTAMLLILVPAAAFHSLSTPTFRWTYDNNPLITVALAGILYCLFKVVFREGPLGRRAETLWAVAIVFALSGAAWSAGAFRYLASQICVERWPEVAALKGARLRPAVSGMREVVATVRRHAPDPRTDSVLLLPNDPNVEDWFERPRPSGLSSVTLFADQYWDRYVDRDFATLALSPPKVIVIGPRDSWREFHRQWNKDWGCERLIDRVKRELIPGRYTPLSPQKVKYKLSEDYMEIYILNEKPTPAVARRD